MKLQKKELIKLNQEVPMVETTKEGRLRGGFVSLKILETEAEEKNVNKNGAFCSCGCYKNPKNCFATTKPTETSEETTVEPTAIGNIFSSMLF